MSKRLNVIPLTSNPLDAPKYVPKINEKALFLISEVQRATINAMQNSIESAKNSITETMGLVERIVGVAEALTTKIRDIEDRVQMLEAKRTANTTQAKKAKTHRLKIVGQGGGKKKSIAQQKTQIKRRTKSIPEQDKL